MNNYFPKRNAGETIQDYVKRLLSWMCSNGKLTPELLQSMQQLEYSKKTFGIAYPLLVPVTLPTEIYDSHGKVRYWINFRLGGKYYACSQWWREKEYEYQQKLYAWAQRVVDLNESPQPTPQTRHVRGELVTHDIYGNGVVVNVTPRYVHVRFSSQSEVKIFPLPDAFLTGKLKVREQKPEDPLQQSKEPAQEKFYFVACPVCGNKIGKMAAGAKFDIVCAKCGKNVGVDVKDTGVTVSVMGQISSEPRVRDER